MWGILICSLIILQPQRGYMSVAINLPKYNQPCKGCISFVNIRKHLLKRRPANRRSNLFFRKIVNSFINSQTDRNFLYAEKEKSTVYLYR